MGIWKALKKTTKATFKASKWTAKTTWKVADRTLDALTFKKLCGDCVWFDYKNRLCFYSDNLESPDYDELLKEIEPWSGLPPVPPALKTKKSPAELNANNDGKWYINTEKEFLYDTDKIVEDTNKMVDKIMKSRK